RKVEISLWCPDRVDVRANLRVEARAIRRAAKLEEARELSRRRSKILAGFERAREHVVSRGERRIAGDNVFGNAPRITIHAECKILLRKIHFAVAICRIELECLLERA